MAEVHDRVDSLPDGLLGRCRTMPLPVRLLMCPPEYFDVCDVKNPLMEGQIGKVDRARARAQWEQLKATFEACGATVELIEPEPGCEDMVFCANQTLPGLDADGQRLCLLSRMKHESRRREVPAFARWFEAHGYRVELLRTECIFEGSGDAIWHPGRGLIWGGYGFRTEPQAYEEISERFGVPVLRLKLTSDRFYHLDTAFCPLDEKTVLYDPPAIAPEGRALIERVFERVIECPHEDAVERLACNATPIGGRHVVIHQGSERTVRLLRDAGYEVHEVDTGEFLKSGGSVFCMKMYVF